MSNSSFEDSKGNNAGKSDDSEKSVLMKLMIIWMEPLKNYEQKILVKRGEGQSSFKDRMKS